MNHGGLTEHSLRTHGVTHDRKGREVEGIKEVEGICVANMHGIATSVARETFADAMPRASR